MIELMVGLFILAWFSYGFIVIRDYVRIPRLQFDKSKVKYFDGDNT